MIFFLLPLLGAIKSESYPKKLTPEEEKYYLDQYHNHNDLNARSKLIEHNLRLVAHIAKKYENTIEDKDDILSIGALGLIKAVDTFQINATNKLATYAARCIENEILMTLRSNKNKKNTLYLESPIGLDKDGNEIQLMDFIEDKDVDIYKSYQKRVQSEALQKALKSLSDREYEVICKRYGINQSPKTQKEISIQLKISRSYVSRIEKRALLKLYLLLKQD